MKSSVIIAIVSLTAVIYAVNAIPQRQIPPNEDPNVQAAIDSIFASSTPRTPSNRGPGVVVTPDPTYTPTTSPLVLTVDDQNCTCVPYHMCDPNTNTVKQAVNDDEVTGFGVIDIRFDPLDCQDVLDVCCIGDAQRTEPIVPKPIEGRPTQAAGCGVRNVGGLDFKLAGAFVRIEL